MQLALPQLASHLQQHGLPPLLSIFGDTPLLVDDALQIIRKFARDQGIDERERYIQDSQFDWRQLTEQSASLSLFSQHRLLELELPEAKPGREGGDALRNYLSAPPPDQTLIVIGPKLKNEQLKAKWYQQLTQAGPVIQANSPDRAALPRFIDQRAGRYGLALAPDAVQLIADWFEGNLLALDQELQKLALMDLPQPVAASEIQQAAQDQSRFSVFALQEAILAADVENALHRLQRLFEEDIEVAILNWMLQREWYKLQRLQEGLATAQDLSTLFRREGIWRNQEASYRQFVQRMQGAPLTQAADLLRRLELAFKRDSGERVQTLVTHLVVLYCRPDLAVRLAAS
ncbi:DNA polymerase III subunit delta [Pseudidiomarina salinarum]|uniref:DNA polymerase III subunit delta n=1 Tax=Pseudidiomarina salinarum TaxID=435908 RepID=UPI000690B033|nr:DNA polymerase III subunit delta [Pseudidiomarina salinarum]RUO70683.1 DNA polymerase III subunit delta [Pseudidiomarina salinarum]